MKGKLTKRVVESTKHSATDSFIWDSELKGFGLKITPRDRRVFIAQYWAPNLSRARRRITIGTFGTLTVEQARAVAQRVLGRVANGEDPAADIASRRRASRECTVAIIGAEYLLDIQAKVKPRTLSEYERLFKRHIVPAVGTKPIDQVSIRDVAEIHTSKRAQPYQANRILNLIGSFLHWSESRGYRPRNSNPCRDITKYPEASRERFLTVDEVGRLGEALETAELAGLPSSPSLRRKLGDPSKAKHRSKNAGNPIPANPFAVASIRFLLLTGWREQEALSLRWSNLDLERGSATLPDTKTGRSHRPVGEEALKVIRALPRLNDSPFVFPGAKDGQPLREIKRVWSAVRHAANLDDLRLHDLRHTVASFAVGGGHSLFVTGKLLGHARAETTQRYAHIADDARKIAADSVSSSLSAALNRRASPAVIPIATRIPRSRKR